MASGVWKYLNSLNSPDVDGFVAGFNEAGNKVFIGRALYDRTVTPGKVITTASPGVRAGLYFESGVAEHFRTEGVEYFAHNPDCSYDWVPAKAGQIFTNAIQYHSRETTFYIGRTHALNSVQVGKVPLTLGIYYTHRGKTFINQPTSYEVLTWTKPCPPIAENPEKPFSVWKPLNANNSPDDDGVVAGVNEAGNKIFIGRATFQNQLAPGRLITTASPGIKAGLTLEHGTERFITEGIEYCATAPNCLYDWEPSSRGQTVHNAVEWFSDAVINANVGSKMYVGRIRASNEVHVGKVNPPGYGFYYTHQGKSFHNQPTYEVLTCTRVAGSCPPVTTEIEKLREEIRTLNKLQAAQKKELEEKFRQIMEKLVEMSTLRDQSVQKKDLEEEIRTLRNANVELHNLQAAQKTLLEKKDRQLMEKLLEISNLQNQSVHCKNCQCY